VPPIASSARDGSMFLGHARTLSTTVTTKFKRDVRHPQWDLPMLVVAQALFEVRGEEVG